jgi:hypothetical protein
MGCSRPFGPCTLPFQGTHTPDLGCFCSRLSLQYAWSFLLPFLQLLPPGLFPRHACGLSSLSMQLALFRAKPIHNFLRFHWLPLSLLADDGHSFIGSLTVPFMSGLACIRLDFPSTVCSTCCLLLLVSHLAYSSTLKM